MTESSGDGGGGGGWYVLKSKTEQSKRGFTLFTICMPRSPPLPLFSFVCFLSILFPQACCWMFLPFRIRAYVKEKNRFCQVFFFLWSSTGFCFRSSFIWFLCKLPKSSFPQNTSFITVKDQWFWSKGQTKSDIPILEIDVAHISFQV